MLLVPTKCLRIKLQLSTFVVDCVHELLHMVELLIGKLLRSDQSLLDESLFRIDLAHHVFEFTCDEKESS